MRRLARRQSLRHDQLAGFDAQRRELTVFRLRYACERAAAALKTFNEVWEDGLRQERERWAESRAATERDRAEAEIRYQRWRATQIEEAP